MMDLLSLCGTALIGIFLIILFKQIKPEFTLPLTVLLGLILLSRVTVLLAEKINFFKTLFSITELGEFWQIMLKVFGIAFIVETTADICRDAGENTVASKIELIGKTEMLIISIPLIEKILEITKELMF